MAKQPSVVTDAMNYLTKVLGRDTADSLSKMRQDDLLRFATLAHRPDIRIKANTTRVPFGAILTTAYGSIYLDDTFTSIEKVYVNGTEFAVSENGLDAIEKLVGSYEDASEVLVRKGAARRSRSRRPRTRNRNEVDFETLQEAALEDLKGVGLTYETIFTELGALLDERNIPIYDIADELFVNNVAEKDIPEFLVYESQYKRDIVGQVQGVNLSSVTMAYNFEPVTADDSFIGRLMTALDAEEAEYDKERGVLKIGERMVYNLPFVDEKGVFSNGDKRYIPYHIGYFAQEEGTRVERLRHIDPVQTAIDAVKLHYNLTSGDVKFKTILDVTRNLPDFDKHPYGDLILDTLKNKLVFDKNLATTNNLLGELDGKADSLGAIAMTMLDDDAAGLIDPYGTSNGSNLGMIMYLTEGSTFNEDGTLTASGNQFSKVGNFMKDYYTDFDNFNRNQMSFTAFLTSTDVQKLNAYYAEFGLLNADDGAVLTTKGAHQFSEEKFTGDKLEDLHGNKNVNAVVLDPDMDPELIKERKLENAIEFAKLNPELDIIVSGMSIASRDNIGVVKEGLSGEKRDIIKLDGSVDKNAMVEMLFMSLPQTAEHKSKDYTIDDGGRNYSTLFRYGLQSKIGEEFYREAFIHEGVRDVNLDKVEVAFQRLGVTFNDRERLVEKGNVNAFVETEAVIDAQSFYMTPVHEIRRLLKEGMVDGQINILLPDNMSVKSPMLNGQTVTDAYGNNIIPIRVDRESNALFTNYGTIPYRYNAIFKALAVGNAKDLETAYSNAVSVDYKQLTRKNNLIKDIDTMTFTEGAGTWVIVADPSLKLDEIRLGNEVPEGSDPRHIIHRDPVIQSGNTISMTNIGKGDVNVLHVNPLIMKMIDGDYDGDTMGDTRYDNLRVAEDIKEVIYLLSNPYEQLNYHGEVFAGIDSAHFKATAAAAGVDTSDLNFNDGKTNAELGHMIEDAQDKIVRSPEAYGAYSINFTNEKTALDSLCKMANDGMKGNVETLTHRMQYPYTREENRANSRALQGKSLLAGPAGMITNNFIADNAVHEFDADFMRLGLDLTHTQSQSVLQMKKNADKLPVIHQGIRTMKQVFAGKFDVETSRQKLKSVTNGMLPDTAVDQFVDMVVARQIPDPKVFGKGLLNGTSMTTTKMAFTSSDNFARTLNKVTRKVEVPTLDTATDGLTM